MALLCSRASSKGNSPMTNLAMPTRTRGMRSLYGLIGLGLFVALGVWLFAGSGGPHSAPEVVWGKHGTHPGDFNRPRAVAIDAQDRLYIVDFTARIQVFDRNGKFLDFCWTTPDYRNGRPSGLSIDRDGNLLVSDSHYQSFRIYSPEGELLRSFEYKPGSAPGQLSYVSDVVQDQEGFYYVAEFG